MKILNRKGEWAETIKSITADEYKVAKKYAEKKANALYVRITLRQKEDSDLLSEGSDFRAALSEMYPAPGPKSTPRRS